MKTNIEIFKANSYYLAANALAFADKLQSDSDFISFLADAALKQLPEKEDLSLELEGPYSLYEYKFDNGLDVIRGLSDEPIEMTIEEATFSEVNNDLFVHIVILFNVKQAAFTYDYIGKLFGPSGDDFDWADISFKLSFDLELPSSTPVDNLPAYEFSDVRILDAKVEEQTYRYDEGSRLDAADESAAVEAKKLSKSIDTDLAEYLYKHLSARPDRYGNLYFNDTDIYSYQDVKDYYSPRITRAVYNATIKALKDGLSNVKFYDGKLELSDRHIAWEIDADIDDEEYWKLADQYSDKFDKEFSVNSGYDGRGARHYVVDDTAENILRYNELKNGLKKYQDEFISYINTHYKPVNESAVTESASKADKQSSLVSLVGALIKDEWDAIEAYTGAISCLKNAKIDGAKIGLLEDIRNEEYLHVGQLQKLLQSLSEGADNINKGEKEGEKQLSATEGKKSSRPVFKRKKPVVEQSAKESEGRWIGDYRGYQIYKYASDDYEIQRGYDVYDGFSSIDEAKKTVDELISLRDR